MNSVNSDNCVVCSKTVKKCHKEISCKICSGFTHKKCTKLKSKQLKCLNVKEWVCPNCCQDVQTSSSDLENEVNNLNKSFDFHLTDVDFQKYDKMLFNPFDLNIIRLVKPIMMLHVLTIFINALT